MQLSHPNKLRMKLKGDLLQDERPQTAIQKAAFWNVKHGVCQTAGCQPFSRGYG